MLIEEPKKSIRQCMESSIPYQEARSLFKDRNFGFFLREDYTEFVFPLAVTIRKFYLPPDAFVVGLNKEVNQLYLYSPSLDGGRGGAGDRLDDEEISWFTAFLNTNGEKISDGMWSISKKIFLVIEALCSEKSKTARKTIVTSLNPYSISVEELESVIKAMKDIVGL